MDEYRRNDSDYQPNFTMRDPDPADDTKQTPYYADPRSNFRNGGHGQTDTYHSYSDNAAGTTGTGSEHYGTTDSYGANNGSYASWDNMNGLGKTRRKKRARRPSPTVSFTRRSLVLMIVLLLIFSGAFGAGGALLADRLSDDGASTAKTGSVKSTGYTLENATGSSMSIQAVTEKAKASIVEIQTESVTSDSWMQQYVTQGAGSGIIITDDGYIMTNNHVINGANKIKVTVDDKEYDADLVGTDSITDVAVLKIKAKNLTPVTYGNSDQLAIGDMAIAIGNPLGQLGGTVTAGIISALDRQLVIDGKTMTLLQTDSSINPGNSGGGLFNDHGQLIGVVVAKSSGSDVEGLGFAIPINTAAEVAQQLMDKGYVSGQPSTGMSYTESNGAQSQDNIFDQFLGGQTSSNVYIYSVDGENAKKAGFRPGDIVTAIDGKKITTFNELSSVITAHKVGDKLKFTVIRDGQSIDIDLVLEEKTS